MTYDPRSAIKNATKAMNKYVRQHERPIKLVNEASPTDTPITTTQKAGACCVLLKSFTDARHLVPDDFDAVKSAADIKTHVRPDGAVYLGAYELQNTPDSLVLVYGPADLDAVKAERLATLERPALMRRHESAKLGPFSANPAPLSA